MSKVGIHMSDPMNYDSVNVCSPVINAQRRQGQYDSRFGDELQQQYQQSLQQSQSNLKVIPANPSLHYSESVHNLITSEALQNTVEMCEVFVIIGVHERTLQKVLTAQSIGETPIEDPHLHYGDSFIERTSIMQSRPESLLKCPAQIIDSYPNILKTEDGFDSLVQTAVGKPQVDPGMQLMNMIKEQYLYLSNIHLICFPDGYYIDTEFQTYKLLEMCGQSTQMMPNLNRLYLNQLQPKIMHFTITQSDGKKKYLTSLEYKEVTLAKFTSGQFTEKKLCIVPRCLCLVSRLPVFQIQKQMLDYLYEDVIKKYHQLFLKEYKETDDFLQIESKLRKVAHLVRPERLEFYLSTFFHHLNIDGSNLEVEIYKKTVDDESGTLTKRTIVRYVNTFNKECLRLENYEFKLLFQKVPPKMLLQMFVSLLHERKIILIHNDSSKNAILIEALISILYPLQWNFTNISYLIPSMVEYLEAPFPYIVGVPRDLWKYIYEQKWDILGEEVVAFDIDNQRSYYKEELPAFPQPYSQLLIKQLEIQLEKSKQLGSSSVRGSCQDSLREEARFWNNFTLKVKQQFLNFLIFLINTFENFYVTASAQVDPNLTRDIQVDQTIGSRGTAPSTIDCSTIGDSRPGGGGPMANGSANDIFNFDEYVQNVRENQPFFEKFVRTQAFINFIEQAFYEEQGNLSDASIRFFKECTRKLQNENIQAVRLMQDNIITGIMHKFNNRSISYSIDKCHIIFDKQLKIASPGKEFLTTKDSQGPPMFLLNKLDHSRIVTMKAFDPRPFIEKRYAKTLEGVFSSVAKPLQLRDASAESTKKQVQIQYNEMLQDFCIDAPVALAANSSQVPLNDYFTMQAPRLNDSSIIEDSRTQTQKQKNPLNRTTQLIKIEDNLDEDEVASNQSQNQAPGARQYREGSGQRVDDRKRREEDQHSSEDEKGLFGFFKKTFSNVKKTFENTFNNKEQGHQQSKSLGRRLLDRAHTPLLENDNDLVESPKRGSRGGNPTVGRTIRSQTFHGQEKPPVRRDRKNNDSFFANLFNLGSGKKDSEAQQESQSLSPRKNVAMNQTLETRSKLNRSGLFVFNDDDLKKMTEMSPKESKVSQLHQRHNGRSSSLQYDLQNIENQLSSRQKPKIKAPSIFNSNQLVMSNRMRSISYQQQQESRRPLKSGSEVKNTRLADLLNESLNQSSIIEESYHQVNQEPTTNREQTVFSIPCSARKSPIHKAEGLGESRNSQDPIATKIFFNNISDLKIKSFRNSPSQSKEASAVKEPPSGAGGQKQQEFEEVYKKSTENLFFAPTVRSIEGGYKHKFNIWKSQSGKVDVKLNSGSCNLNNASQSSSSNAQKPPKHHQPAKPLKKEQKYGSVHKVESNKTPASGSALSHPIEVKPIGKKEEKKLLQRSLEGILSDKNSTDEDYKAPILGKNLAQFKNIMHSKPFDKPGGVNGCGPGVKKSPSYIQKANNKHKRQLSGGTVNQLGGATHIVKTEEGFIQQQKSLNLNSIHLQLLENIEPEDDTKNYISSNKQIESMQIGRVRRKSNNKTSGGGNASKIQSRKGSYINQQKGPGQRSQIEYALIQKSNQQTLLAKQANIVQSTMAVKKSRQKVPQLQGLKKENTSSNVKDEPEKAANKAHYQNIQAKTVHSSSYSSAHNSSSISHDARVIAMQLDQDESNIKDSIRPVLAEEVKTSRKDKESTPTRNQQMMIEDSAYISLQSQSEIVNGGRIQRQQPTVNSLVNRSIDLRDSKKGEFLRLRSQAAVISPTSSRRDLLAPPQQQAHVAITPSGGDNFLAIMSKGFGPAKMTPVSDSRLHSQSQFGEQNSLMMKHYQIQIQQPQNTQGNLESSQDQLTGPLSNDKMSCFRSNLKPLSKITWEAFNQIAKLSGDIDHEPCTPKSGANISDEVD